MENQTTLESDLLGIWINLDVAGVASAFTPNLGIIYDWKHLPQQTHLLVNIPQCMTSVASLKGSKTVSFSFSKQCSCQLHRL